MFARALKTNIIISLVVLLTAGMLLIDFVLIRTTQREMIQDKASKGYLAASVLRDILSMHSMSGSLKVQSEMAAKTAEIVSQPDVAGVWIADASNRIVYSAGKNLISTKELATLGKTVRETEDRALMFSGKTWGVFWYQRKYLTVSVPVTLGNSVAGSVGIQMNLKPIYLYQRHSQRFVIFYLAVNTLILTVIGYFRLSKVYLEPINRLVRTAEDYQETDGAFFSVRKQDNELSKLSKALNMMIRRISEDKQKLRSTVASLEKTNMELQKAQREIIRAEKLASIGRLSSGIAHEIGNPIGIIMGYLDLIKRETIPSSEKNEFVRRIEKEINRMDTVIRQLLDLSRPYEAVEEIVGVHEIIQEMTQVLSIQPLTSNIRIALSLDAGSDRVKADVNQLRQIFLNLVINAADAIASNETEREGALTIRTEIETTELPGPQNDRGKLKIMFVDTGPGIPAEHLENIFDPFFTTKAPGKGTGLGLSVCFMIVESLGGRISAENTAGIGTTMTLWLPLADS